MQPFDLESTSDTPQSAQAPMRTRAATWNKFNFGTPRDTAQNETESAKQPLKTPVLSFGFSELKTPFSSFGRESSFGSNAAQIPSQDQSPAFGASSFGRPSFGASSFGGQQCFGSNGAQIPSHSSTLAIAASPFGTSSFGGKPTFGSSGSFPVAKSTLSPPPLSSSLPAAGLPGGDALSRATRRAVQHRPAIFGRQDVAADSMMAKALRNLKGSPGINDLVADLVGVAKDHPIAMDFLQYIFDEAATARHTLDVPPTPREIYAKLYGTQNDHQKDYQKDLEGLLDAHFCRNPALKWGKDLCDYIIRMIVHGCSPREIRDAIKADMDYTHGHNHVSNQEVDRLVDWLRFEMADLSEKVRFAGSALDLFRPSMREEKKLGKFRPGSELTRWAEGSSKVAAVQCCAHKRPVKVTHDKAASNKASGSATQRPDAGTDEKLKVFRFMDMPPEMRVRVYNCGLVPTGYVSLRSCAHHMPVEVVPALLTSIFRVSKIINRESAELQLANTIIVNVCLESGVRPAVHRNQLPEHILPLIKSLVLVVDFTRVSTLGDRTADLRFAQGLTGLKKLRICGLATRTTNQRLQETLRLYLCVILERVPASCEVVFGEEGEEAVEEHMRDMAQKIKDEAAHVLDSTRPLRTTYAMGGSRLESAWKDIEENIERGCKSGAKEDFRFEERRAKAEADQWDEMRLRREVGLGRRVERDEEGQDD